jgi:hypothetical protein
MLNELRHFLALSYDELEELNLKAKKQRKKRTPFHTIQEERLKYMSEERRIEAVTALFSNVEGRLHMRVLSQRALPLTLRQLRPACAEAHARKYPM